MLCTARAQENADLYKAAGRPLRLTLQLVDYQAPGTYDREYWEVCES